MMARRGLGLLLYLVILCTLASGLVLYCVGRLVLFWICWCHLHGVEAWNCCWWWSGSCGLEGGGSLWWQCWWWRGRQPLLVKKLDLLARAAIGLDLRSLLSRLLWSPRPILWSPLHLVLPFLHSSTWCLPGAACLVRLWFGCWTTPLSCGLLSGSGHCSRGSESREVSVVPRCVGCLL